MKPIRHTKTARLQPLKMYLEEIEELVALFHKKCAKVTISDKQYSYESLSDLKAHVPKMGELDIQGENPGLHLLLNHAEETIKGNPQTRIVINELRTEEISDEADALFREVKDFLTEHEQPRVRKLLLVLAIVPAGGVIWFATHIYKYRENVSALGLVACISGFALLLIMSLNSPFQLTLESKLDSQSFWAVNKDKIWLLIIGAIVGIASTLVTQFLSRLIAK